MEEKVLKTKDKMKYTNKNEKRNVDIMRLRGRKLCLRDCAGGEVKIPYGHALLLLEEKSKQ